MRPHVLGIDDAPFRKDQSQDVPIVGVMMEGATLVEGIAIGSFPVDGEGATDYLAQWIIGLRWHLTLQAVVLGGITLAGLGIIDLENLAQHLALPVIAVTRHNPAQSRLSHAIAAAGFYKRLSLLERIPPAPELEPGLYVAMAGAERSRCCTNSSSYPQQSSISRTFTARSLDWYCPSRRSIEGKSLNRERGKSACYRRDNC